VSAAAQTASIVILISGRGSNMLALLAARPAFNVAAVISNEPLAAGVVAARRQGVATRIVDHRAYAERAAFDAALTGAIDAFSPELVVLAGFMRILTDPFVGRYAGRLVNIHPALLPAFPGLNTHRRALAAGVRIHGCTVHFVTTELDGGPIIAQAAVPVAADDTEQTLAARVLEQEHRLYPQVVRWICEGRVELAPDGRVTVRQAGTPAGSLASPPLDRHER
jgi:phosphoribosylglycinamide formyltransferase-1